MYNHTIKAISVFDEISYELHIEEGIIKHIGEIPREKNLPYMSPGLIDTQINGFLGFDYSNPLLSQNEIYSICKELIKTGTFQHFATIVTSPPESIKKSIKNIVDARENNPLIQAAISGIHIEGPFISPEDGFRGAHNLLNVRDANVEEFKEWLEIGGSLIKTITIAPEVKNAINLIKFATSKGVICAIGHTNANETQIRKAVDAGAVVSTHLGNGNREFLDRLNNPIWYQLAERNLKISLITDLIHIPLPVIKVFTKVKGASNIILVSDLAPVAGTKPGKTNWGDLAIEVKNDNSIRLAGTPYLAGAGSSLLQNIINLWKNSELSLHEIFAMATTIPAKTYLIDNSRLEIKSGKPADFFLFNLDESNKRVSKIKTFNPNK